MTSKEIHRGIEWAGGKEALGRKVGVSFYAVDHWLRTGAVPAAKAMKLERLSRGKLTAKRLAAPDPARSK